MGILGACAALSSVFGAPLAADVQVQFGWRMAVLGFGAVAVVGALIFAPLYRAASRPAPPASPDAPGKAAPRGSAFTHPLVWVVAVLCGLAGVTSLATVYELPGAAKELFPEQLSGAKLVSAGFLVAVFINLLFGFLMDRFHKWRVMAFLVVILIVGSLLMVSSNAMLFAIGGVVVVAVGHAAIQQSYSIAAEVFHGKETGNVMGIVSFMSGGVNFVVPWALGILRDKTGGFNAGWYTLAGISTVTLIMVIMLWRRNTLVSRTPATPA
jgi:cyanate permease